MASVEAGPHTVGVPRVDHAARWLTFSVPWAALEPGAVTFGGCAVCGTARQVPTHQRTVRQTPPHALWVEAAWLLLVVATLVVMVPSHAKAGLRDPVHALQVARVLTLLAVVAGLHLLGALVVAWCTGERGVVPLAACDTCRRRLMWLRLPGPGRVMAGPMSLGLALAVLPSRWENWCFTCVSPSMASHLLLGVVAGLAVVVAVAARMTSRTPRGIQLVARNERVVVLHGPRAWMLALGGSPWTPPTRSHWATRWRRRLRLR